MARPDRPAQLSLQAGYGGTLFSEHFLQNALPAREEFAAVDAEPLLRDLTELLTAERARLASANEAQTEERFIRPILKRLGFEYLVQAGLKVGYGRRAPDYALFGDPVARETAAGADDRGRYAQAVAVADAKRFDRPLDHRVPAGALSEDPVAQITHYVTATRCKWGLLTNGRIWRLYSAEVGLLEARCFEVDLVALIDAGDARELRYFAVFFGVGAFREGPDGRSFLDRALAESTANAVRVGAELEKQVFLALPLIATGLIGEEQRTPEALADAFENALVLLYRLLFCLYAEARGLLPVEESHYRDYSLQKHKFELAEDRDRGRVFSGASDDLYNDLRGLFRMIDRGDRATGVPEYNGGLFSPAKHRYFEGRFVPDDLLAGALDRLYRVAGQFVDYADLSVRQLGSIYERLLERRLVEVDGELMLEHSSGRHESGSYFTPTQVVDRIIERVLTPVLEQTSRANLDAESGPEEALSRFLEIRVLDPAMGSGHFLVAAVGYVAQWIATDPSYTGTKTLGDIRRLVAEHCLFGIDLNPMAVELSQLSLWLATARYGEPLTFLNNLRVGNSLVGASVAEVLEGGGTLFGEQLARSAEEALALVAEIDAVEGDRAAGVREKEELAGRLAEALLPLREIADDWLISHQPSATVSFHWQLAFPEVFLGRDGRPAPGGGFDAIIGNPPYVRIQELGRDLAAYCRARYATAAGSFDLYVPFVERSLSLLAECGRLGFIVPNKFLKVDYGTRLRAVLSERGAVEELVDFGDAQLFVGATNYTCILILSGQPCESVTYRRVSPEARDQALADFDSVESEPFALDSLGSGPWVMATGDAARVVSLAARNTERLDEVTGGIFTGLQTSADPVYILEDRGRRGPNRLVYSKASDRELELEPGLLHPLASGADVERHAFRPLEDLLLFPYLRVDGAMRLIDSAGLEGLPLTRAYLGEHETMLRARERGKMDREGWWAFGRTQSLGLHDLPKLGVAATVQRLEIAADLDGSVYFHNVRVNGILEQPDGIALPALLALLNSRLLDFVFRVGAAQHTNGYYAANKQFIAPLPIRVPASSEAGALTDLGTRLHADAGELLTERQGFLDWLSGALGARVQKLPGSTRLMAYDSGSLDELLSTLGRARAKLTLDPGSRSFRERVRAEFEASLDRIEPLRARIARDELTADAAVLDLYEIPERERKVVMDI